MATTHEAGSLTEAKPPKSSRRKMSWFKQASIGEKLTRLRLPRQNTLDCPNSAPVTAPASSELLASSRRRIASGSSVEVCDTILDDAPTCCSKIITVNYIEKEVK